MWQSTLLRSTAALFLALAAPACVEDASPGGGDPDPDSAAVRSGSEAAGRSYERAFVFAAVEGDTLVLVPVLFTARAGPRGVDRRIRGWLGRAGTWEPFVDERWRTEPSGTAWRILPRGPVRLVVGEDDAIETIIFRQPPRVLELDLGQGLVEWTGARGGVYRLEETTLVLGTRRFSGVALDLARSHGAADPPGGDWAFLVSGDSLQVVLHAPEVSEPGTENAWTAFVRLDFRQLQWPNLTLDWSQRQSFDAARREVPAGWSFRSRTEEIEGSLEATSAQLSAGEDDGPVLPVSALFAVEGTVSVAGAEYPVQGLVRHRRE